MLYVLIADLRAEVDLGDAEGDGLLHDALVHARAAVEDKGNVRELAHLAQHVQLDVRLAFVVAMGVSDADCKRVRRAQIQELADLLGVGHVLVLHHNAVVQALQLADLGFDGDVEIFCHVDDALRQRCVFLDGARGAVDHHGREAQTQRLHADGEAVAVVQMDGHRHGHLAGAPLRDVDEPVVAGKRARGDVVRKDDGGSQFFCRLADAHDDVIVSALRVDGRDGVPLPRGFPELFQIVRQHMNRSSENQFIHSCVP